MELLKLLLNYNFYDKNKAKILSEFFPSDLQNLYSLIIETHDKLKKDLSIHDIKLLYKKTYATATLAHLNEIEKVLETLPEIDVNVAEEVLKKAWVSEIGRQIVQLGTDITNRKTTSFEKARALIEKIEQGSATDGDDFKEVSSNLDDILEAINITTKWPFNIPDLAKVCGGLGPGVFCIIAGRPEAGKSALGISLCSSPKGFAEQGALCHFYVNEEAAQRHQARSVMSYTGLPLLGILNRKDEVAKTYAQVKDKLKFFNSRDKSVYEIGAHVKQTKPDIVVFDQADKMSIPGNFMREDERLGALYVEIRNILAREDAGGIALTQLNAESEGKTYVHSANLSNSRTAKSAEGDIVLGLGKGPGHSEEMRVLNPIKSKLTGCHLDVTCVIRPEISRFIA